MLFVQQHITKKQQDFKNHSFFHKLKEQDDFVKTMNFASKLAFWVMAFQDILRLIPPRIQTKELRRIATHHKMEDAGHHLWFLEDMGLLEKDKNYTVAWLFSKENAPVRDFAYHVMSEALTLPKDHLKITLILILESTGHIFFEHMAAFAKLKGYDSNLKYFSSSHLEVERNHAVFEERLMNALFGIKLSDKDRLEATDLVERVYDGFHGLFTELHAHLLEIEEDKRKLVA